MMKLATPLAAGALWVVLATCGATTACRDGSPAPADSPRHLLLITVDTLRADHVGSLGGRNHATPNMDRLAADGTIFTHAYAARGLTLPSLTSVMTSRYPRQHGVVRNRQRVPDSEITIAERLSEAGFETRMLAANYLLHPVATNIGQGFAAAELIHIDRWITDKAEAHLRRLSAGSPRQFVWLHYFAPHQPYEPDPEHLARFPDALGSSYDGSDTTLLGIFESKTSLSPADRLAIEAYYDGEVSAVDDAIGRLLATLDATGLARDTLVIVTADHGEDLYDHNCYFLHANSIYGSSTHVPLIVRWPGGVAAGRRVQGLVELVDLAPTLLDYLGVAVDDDLMEGRSLRPAIDGTPVDPDHHVFHQWQDDIFAVRDAGWLYIWNPREIHPDEPPGHGSYPIGRQELYDTVADPAEQVDVAADHPDEMARLHLTLERFLAAHPPPTSAPSEADEEQLDRLRSLGYIDDDTGGGPPQAAPSGSGDGPA